MARVMRSPSRLRSMELRYGHRQLEPIWPQRYCMPGKARLERTAAFLVYATQQLYAVDSMSAPAELACWLARCFNDCIATVAAAVAALVASGEAAHLPADLPSWLAGVARFLQRARLSAELDALLAGLSPPGCTLQLHPHSLVEAQQQFDTHLIVPLPASVNQDIQAAGMFVAGQAPARRSPDWWTRCPVGDAAPDGAGLMLAPLQGALLTVEQRAGIVAPCDLVRHVAGVLARHPSWPSTTSSSLDLMSWACWALVAYMLMVANLVPRSSLACAAQALAHGPHTAALTSGVALVLHALQLSSLTPPPGMPAEECRTVLTYLQLSLCLAAPALYLAATETEARLFLLPKRGVRPRLYALVDRALTARRRGGVPQQIQPHVLVGGGCAAAEALLPGFRVALLARGAVPIDDLAAQVLLFVAGARCSVASSPDADIRILCATRRLIEQTMRQLVLERCGGTLELRDGTKVAGLAWDEAKREVVGVELASGEVVAADLVADCKIVYSCAWFRRPAGQGLEEAAFGGKRAGLVKARPVAPRGGAAFPAEDGLWQVFLYGYDGDRAAPGREGMLEFAATLPDPSIHDAIAKCEMLTPVMHFASTANIAHGYHAVPLPPGLLLIGDCVQALDPIYGQGMSVAAQSARELCAAMGEAVAGAKTAAAQREALRAMGPAWQARLAKLIAQARGEARSTYLPALAFLLGWAITSAEDMRFPHSVGKGVSRPPALLTAYFDAVQRLVLTDRQASGCARGGGVGGQVYSDFWGASMLVRPLSNLKSLRVLLKVLWLVAREALGLAPRAAPAGLPPASVGGSGSWAGPAAQAPVAPAGAE
eukprot:scaffold9.g3309.t1